MFINRHAKWKKSTKKDVQKRERISICGPLQNDKIWTVNCGTWCIKLAWRDNNRKGLRLLNSDNPIFGQMSTIWSTISAYV